MHSKVLVLDGNEFSTLAIIRSLGRKNLNITVGSELGANQPISKYSKFTKDIYLYPDPLTNANEFVAHVLDFISQNAFDLVIPVTEKTSLLLAKYKSEIEQHTRLAIPDVETLEFVSDKSQTFAIAKKENVPIPQSIDVNDTDELNRIVNTLTYPIVIKPSRSVTDSHNIRTKLIVQYAFNEQELLKKCQAVLRHTPVILQSYFRGDGVGVEILANHGEIILSFQHLRLHEMPLTGGGSCLRKSVPVNPQLLEYATRLIKHLNWHGVAMLEFKYNAETRQSCLMEINGRFWGSLPLAVDSGADFPYQLYRLLVLNDTSVVTSTIEIGRLNRKLKDDFYWLLIVIFRRDNNPLIIWEKPLQLLEDFVSIFSNKHRFDSFSYDDPKPFFVDNFRTFAWIYDLASEFASKFYWQQKFNVQKKRGIVKTPLKSANSILFLCYGNINRSVAAHKCLEQHLGNSTKLRVESVGFHSQKNRPADSMMVKIAAESAVDLNNWSSRCVTQEYVDNADVILVMEIAHFHRLVKMYPNSKAKTHLLGSVSADKKIPLELIDPFEQSIEIYTQCFNHINLATKAIVDLIK
jgi:predicted ATP-grasp superfamily ATP-dependent carboligase/protein-tyrosine-phosphatase